MSAKDAPFGPALPIRVAKLKAAELQLDMAIELWFGDRDPVSIHTLAGAAHEVIHDILEKRYPPGLSPDLLFNTLNIKDEHLGEFEKLLKKPQNFFKHADRDPDPEGAIGFSRDLTELFVLYALVGLEHLGVRHSTNQSAFIFWLAFHKPDMLTDKGRQTFLKPRTDDELARIASIPKGTFLRAYQAIQDRAGAT